MVSVRFFHIADVHLDSPFKGIYNLSERALKEMRSSTFAAFDRIIQHALQEKPDFLLFVGDVYDGENRSLKAQRYFQQGMEQLCEANIPVIMSHGNHDHLNGTWTRFALPSNVKILPKELTTIELNARGQSVKIYGFSYSDRHIAHPMIDKYPMAEQYNTLHIGMLHGSVAGDMSHAVYAPFTKEALLSKGYDYWALGHIHKRQLLHEQPPIVYPGNTQSRHRNEQGVKGFYDVCLMKGQADLQFVPTSAIVYETIQVQCQGMMHANELLVTCKEAIAQYRVHFGAIVVSLELICMDDVSLELLNSSSMDEWLDVIREMEYVSEPFTWIQSLQVKTEMTDDVATPITEAVLAVIAHWQYDDWKDVLKDVYQHTSCSRFLDPLTIQQTDMLKEQASQLLRKQLSK